MQNEKRSAFTLIELLIVVAIIAILAAIAVPNFLDAQVRAKISRAQADMRSLATGIEAYRVDNNSYPCAVRTGIPEWGWGGFDSNNASIATITAPCGGNGVLPNPLIPFLTNTDYDKNTNLAPWRMTFATAQGLNTLTTPVAFISSYPSDPFADQLGFVFGYTNMDNKYWVLWSFGPDGKDNLGGGNPWGDVPFHLNEPKTTDGTEATSTGKAWNCMLGGGLVINPNLSNPTATLIAGQLDQYGNLCIYTYDGTNGTKSSGDIYRLKQ